ncbi:DUF1700 domain-containing protein [Undibacterium arcticum]|uniref:DUF1700 domain-containing protein n=1 Tax=Undibacterium arcticum TaxID=1762892 RepID=A0ABV7EZ68_9BURK
MTRQEYIDAVRAGLSGLPDDVVARKIADYEQRFMDGAIYGRGADDVARDLGDPKKVAAEFRASMHMDAFAQQKSPRNLWRLLMSLLGLMIFNLFMAIPAFVFSTLLFASYVIAAAFFAGGIALTASGLSGVDELVMNAPFDHVRIDASNSNHGDSSIQDIHIDSGKAASAAANVERESEHLQFGPYGVQINAESTPTRAAGAVSATAASAEPQHESGRLSIGISNDDDQWSTSAQTWQGVGLIFGGIAIFLLSLVVTRYTVIGIKRYVMMNYSMLKNA